MLEVLSIGTPSRCELESLRALDDEVLELQQTIMDMTETVLALYESKGTELPEDLDSDVASITSRGQLRQRSQYLRTLMQGLRTNLA